jgi:hypothetical protein
MKTYVVGDVISHDEDARITREKLLCRTTTKSTGIHVYISVWRGMLVGVSKFLGETKGKLEVDLGQLVQMYYSLAALQGTPRQGENSNRVPETYTS